MVGNRQLARPLTILCNKTIETAAIRNSVPRAMTIEKGAMHAYTIPMDPLSKQRVVLLLHLLRLHFTTILLWARSSNMRRVQCVPK